MLLYISFGHSNPLDPAMKSSGIIQPQQKPAKKNDGTGIYKDIYLIKSGP
jgi:hypothetical protein